MAEDETPTTTATNEFTKTLLSRQKPPGEKFPVGDFDKASEGMKVLMMENHNTSAIIFVDRLGWARMGAAIIILRADGTPTYTLTNLSNTELVPALVGKEIFQMHVGVAERRAVPKHAIKGTPLPAELLEGQTQWTGTNNYIYLEANCYIVPGGKDTLPWIEGLASDPQVQACFETHFGEGAGAFLKSVLEAAEHT